ncbi:hypothetical protein [Dasineura jujubifolia toursvirus 2a]|nr:hypothetical protein [Dasineura jujubifolia toursvirus 2a]
MKGNKSTNPVKKYPHPPFPLQIQKYPGIMSKMSPIPDCGEDSYIGCGRLNNMNTLITGGDSGIGRAVAIAFSREGANVAINYLEEEESDASEVIEIMSNEGKKYLAIPGDLKSEKFCEYLIDSVINDFGGIDVLINCAARQIAVKDITKISTEQFDETMKTNVYSMFWLCKRALHYMKPGSSIVNTSSGMAYSPTNDLLDYCTSKGAVVSFTKALAKQTTPKGIRVNAIVPGPFWTPLEISGGQLKQSIPNYGLESPMGRPGQPTEISHLYVLLASKVCSYASGQIWSCDGGKTDM